MKKGILISKIELENIKSYKRDELEFFPGITVITGNNGAGKSTLFEAVGHCLFGVEPQDFIGSAKNFISFNKRSGKIAVEFTGVDGVSYRVEKDIPGSRTIYISTGDGWATLEGMREAPLDFIRNKMGLKTSIGLEDMFKNIVGPFQADFVTPFQQKSKTERAKRFDRILGIHQWKDLDLKTRPWIKAFESRIEKVEERIGDRESIIVDLPRKEDELVSLVNEKVSISKELQELNKIFEKVASCVESLEKIEKELNKKRNKQIEVRERLAGLEKEKKIRAEDLQKILQAEEIVRLHGEGFNAYQQGEKKLQQAQEEKKRALLIEKEIHKLKEKIAGMEAEIREGCKSLEEYKEKIIKETAHINRLKREKQEELVKAEKIEVQFQHRLAEKEILSERVSSTDIDIISRKSGEINELIEAINNEEKEIRIKKQRLEEWDSLLKLSREYDGLKRELQQVDNEIGSITEQIKSEKKNKKFLKEGVCPIFNETCGNLGGKEPADYFDEKIDILQRKKGELEENKTRLDINIKSSLEGGKKLEALKKDRESMQKNQKNIIELQTKIRNAIKEEEISEFYRDLYRYATEIKEKSYEQKGTQITGEYHEIESLLNSLNSRLLGEAGNMDINQALQDIGIFSMPGDLKDYPPFLDEIHTIMKKVKDCMEKILKFRLRDLKQQYKEKSNISQSLRTTLGEYDNNLKKLESEGREIQKKEDLIKKQKSLLSRQTKEIELKENEYMKYKGIDEKIDIYKKILEENRQAFLLYQQNIKEAQRLQNIKDEINRLEGEWIKTGNEIKTLSDEIQLLEEKFNPEDLSRYRREKEESFGKIREKTATLQGLEKREKELTEDILRLKKIREEIQKLKKEKMNLKKGFELSKFLREDILRKVADRVSGILRKEISHRAGDIYRQISGGNEDLNWDDNYSITLTDRAGTRSDSQLSGGQFMSAVIALRLALIQTVGSTVAFFDEPTSNLDRERRKNLSSAFRRLDIREGEEERWYSQIFLVSHDESFQDITARTVELELDDDKKTRVCSRMFHRLRVTV